MATVTGFTAARMLQIENTTIVDGDVVGNNLILKRRDLVEINAGNVRGPTGSPGVTTAELNSFAALHVPTGSILDYIGVTAPTGWLLMTGQIIVNGEMLHPLLWSVIPVSMKSGSSIVMPDARRRVSVAYDAAVAAYNAINKVGGEEKHALTVDEMPLHQHTISHDHPSTQLTALGGLAAFQEKTVQSGTGSTVSYINAQNTGVAMTTDIPAYVGGSGFTGRDWIDEVYIEAHNNTQPFIVFQKMIKAV